MGTGQRRAGGRERQSAGGPVWREAAPRSTGLRSTPPHMPAHQAAPGDVSQFRDFTKSLRPVPERHRHDWWSKTRNSPALLRHFFRPAPPPFRQERPGRNARNGNVVTVAWRPIEHPDTATFTPPSLRVRKRPTALARRPNRLLLRLLAPRRRPRLGERTPWRISDRQCARERASRPTHSNAPSRSIGHSWSVRRSPNSQDSNSADLLSQKPQAIGTGNLARYGSRQTRLGRKSRQRPTKHRSPG